MKLNISSMQVPFRRRQPPSRSASCRRSGPLRFRFMTLAFLTLTAALIIFVTGIWTYFILHFWTKFLSVCRVDQSALFQQKHSNGTRPLIEYYVHGRGMGHFQRSLLITEFLNSRGYDMRLFLPLHLHDVYEQLRQNHTLYEGSTTVATLNTLPRMNLYDSALFVTNQIEKNCQVSMTEQRYPMLVISDGDMSGMYRAALGNLPIVSLSHGHLFYLFEPPENIRNTRSLREAWSYQYVLNYRTAIFSTHILALHYDLAMIERQGIWTQGALSPPLLRPTIEKLAAMRRNEGDILPPPSDNGTQSILSSLSGTRPVVLCYFRDRNGEHAIKALLESGIDVVYFDRGGSEKHVRTQQRCTKENHGNLVHVTDISLLTPLFHHADGVLSSAGFQLMSECIALGLPLFALFAEGDTEQSLNVAMSPDFVKGCSIEELIQHVVLRKALRRKTTTTIRRLWDEYIASVRLQYDCRQKSGACSLNKDVFRGTDIRDRLLKIIEKERRETEQRVGLSSGNARIQFSLLLYFRCPKER